MTSLTRVLPVLRTLFLRTHFLELRTLFLEMRTHFLELEVRIVNTGSCRRGLTSEPARFIARLGTGIPGCTVTVTVKILCQ